MKSLTIVITALLLSKSYLVAGSAAAATTTGTTGTTSVGPPSDPKNTVDPGLVNRPQYPYPNGQSNYKIADYVPGYLFGYSWNVTDDLQYGTGCIENTNCTSQYCAQDTNTCQPACKVLQGAHNSSNGCYCEQNTECASQYCGGGGPGSGARTC